MVGVSIRPVRGVIGFLQQITDRIISIVNLLYGLTAIRDRVPGQSVQLIVVEGFGQAGQGVLLLCQVTEGIKRRVFQMMQGVDNRPGKDTFKY